MPRKVPLDHYRNLRYFHVTARFALLHQRQDLYPSLRTAAFVFFYNFTTPNALARNENTARARRGTMLCSLGENITRSWYLHRDHW